MTTRQLDRSAPAAWQPFTWGGVAAFAHAPLLRLFILAGAAALLIGWVVERVVNQIWLPAVERAVVSLPATGEIKGGQLLWPTNSLTPLAESAFLVLQVNPKSAPAPGQAADVHVEIGRTEVRIGSLFGYATIPYSKALNIPLNRSELEPVWRAWRPYLRGGLLGGTALVVFVSWVAWAILATPLLRLQATLLRRHVSLAGCWKLAMAAMVPGGLAIAAALLLYASRSFRLLDFILAFALAHVLQLILMGGAVFALPGALRASPFSEPESAPAPEAEAEVPEEAPVADSPILADSPFAAAAPPVRPLNPFSHPSEDAVVPPAANEPQAPPPTPRRRPAAEEDSEPFNPS